MSADPLREAASMMRERVSAVRDARAHCPGEKHGGPNARYSWVFISNAFAAHAPGDATDPDLKEVWDADAKHLDPWQNVDLTRAIANLLDSAPCSCPPCSCCGSVWQCDGCEPREAALDVARAYLNHP